MPYLLASRTGRVTIVVRAAGMLVVIVVDMMAVGVVRPGSPTVMPVSGPVIPIPGRYPANPRGAPKPVINHGTIDIYRLNDIVLSIYPCISHDLYAHLRRRRIFLHQYGCYILIDVLCQHGLDDDQVTAVALDLHYSQIIHHAVSVQIQVGDVTFFRVQLLLKLLQVTYFAKQGGYSSQIQIFADISTCGRDGYCFVRTNPQTAHPEQQGHQ